VAIVKSQRAKTILSQPRFRRAELDREMKRYPGDRLALWCKVELDLNIVKNLSFYGTVSDAEAALLESMASLLIGKPISKLDELTVRECEAFLRDRNSEAAIDGMTETDETELRKVFLWVRATPSRGPAKEYRFHSEKGPFRGLKLVEKVRELKAFLNAPEILTLYQGLVPPELVDVEELTVYIQAPYGSPRERGLFEQLHLLGVHAFQEENLNFIPDA
jgi:hypothetical protein